MFHRNFRNGNTVRLILMTVCVLLLILLTAVLFVYVLQQPGKNDIPVFHTNFPSSVSERPFPVSPKEEEQGGEVSSPAQKTYDWNLVLVNSDNRLPDDFRPEIVAQNGVEMDRRIADAYQKMHSAALQDGIYLWISSGYRSPELQDKLFKQETALYLKKGLSQTEAEREAEKSVQRPWYSEHNTGLALDFNGVTQEFQKDSAYQWLQNHAEEYGFILRYPKEKQEITKIVFEPWHYRYVGVEDAKEMNRMGMCLEEYVKYKKSMPGQQS